MPADLVADDIVVEAYGTVTPPTAPPEGAPMYKKGDVVRQTRNPDGWLFKVIEDRGGTLLAQPLDPSTRKPARNADGVLEPVELNAIRVEAAV